MLYRKLGHTNIDVSAVGFGAWAIGGWMWGGTDDNDAIEAIHSAIAHGVNLIDTAPIYGYGHSEELVGKAIQGCRDKIVLATKCGMIWDREEGEFFFHANQEGVSFRASEKKVYKCLKPTSIREELERSLRRLGVAHIDLYQTHWQDATTPIADTMAELLKMKDEGKIRAIGVSNASLEQIKEYGPIDADQEKFSILDRDLQTDGTLAFCAQQKISMLAYSPLANGLLTGKLSPDRQYGPGDLRRGNRRFAPANVNRINAMLEPLRPMAERHQATLGQLIIAWTTAQPGMTCVLCGARNAAQAAENAAAGNIQLSPDEIETIRNTVQP
jgi:aryl-alcohol dehydrogenase-like predicted oxidoreductase